jgi:signal transduction histidine kinase
MEDQQRGIDWKALRFKRIPVEHKESFLRDTGLDNLVRLQLLCLVLIPLSIVFLVKPGVSEALTENLQLSSKLVNGVFGSLLLLILTSVHFLRVKMLGVAVWKSRLPVMVVSILLLWWSGFVGTLQPLGITPVIFFMLGLFALFSVFILTVVETLAIMLNGLFAFYWFHVSFGSMGAISLGTISGLLFFTAVGFLISRVVYQTRLSVFLNWENISSMNSTLKWQIKVNQQTMKELEEIKNDLDRQVGEKTSYLRDANQRLQEEIAERSYADKVKSVLYRISGIVNQNMTLDEMIRNIHEQLRQILDVTNFLVGAYDAERFEITPVFQENSTESFERYPLGRTLSSWVIRHKRPLLVNRKKIREMAASGEIEIVGTPAQSWLGIPLKVDERVVGIMMVQSYRPNVSYDTNDLQVLEYASEHLALAIDRHEVQSKLIRAKEQAEESDRLKSAFLSNLSHEIRTPLNSILGFTEVLADPDFTDDQRQRYTTQVLESGHRLLNTITKMIELAKLQSRQTEMEITELEVGEVIEGMRDDIHSALRVFKKSDLDIRFICDSDTAKMKFRGDGERFSQVFRCLAENAVKFTETGFVEVGCRRYDHRQMLFWVKDTGSGMNQGELTQVFEWFIKGEHANERVVQGTGLGLTISKLMVELMKGQIWAESEPGKGSTFYFTLPAVATGSVNMLPDAGKQQKSDEAGANLHAV